MISSNRLVSGSSGKIMVSIDTTERSGPLVKYITIYSNDRTQPLVTLSVTMDVVKK